MENISDVEKIESIKSFQSTIRKTEKGLDQMLQKGAHTTLIEKRLQALNIGLAMLENVWHQKSHSYSAQELVETRKVLTGLVPSIEAIFSKCKEGSPQKTLLKRRLRSLEIAVEVIDDFLTTNEMIIT